ncbi:MAG TPA: hypothetical protein VH442_01810, partial [Micromonosporaceae bacterium]
MARVRPARTREELQSQFRDIAAQASAQRARFDAAAFALRPEPDRWSAAECLVHLNMSVDPYFPMWRDAVEKSAGTRPAARERYRLDV